MNMKVLWRILFVAYTAGYFSSAVGAFASEGTESNLDENKSRLIRGRRDENGLRLDSFDGMSIKEEKPSNDYSTLYEYPSLDMETPVSQDSSSDEIKTMSDIQDPLLEGKMFSSIFGNSKHESYLRIFCRINSLVRKEYFHNKIVIFHKL